MHGRAERHRKVFGQHFLINQPVIEEIVSAALNLAKNAGTKTLVEIGPGRGALTLPLQKEAATFGLNLIAIEKDRELFAALGDKVKAIESDFLDLKAEDWISDEQISVVSNLPYSAATAILTRLCESWEKIPAMVLMFQQEVAQRIRAEEDTSARGSLSMYVQNLYEVKRLIAVPENAFRPPPKVKSEVLTFIRRPKSIVRNDRLWERMIHLAFLHRRKMLRNNFSADPLIAQAFAKSGIDPTLRAQHLTWAHWKLLYGTAASIS